MSATSVLFIRNRKIHSRTSYGQGAIAVPIASITIQSTVYDTSVITEREVGASMTSPRVCEHVRRSREPRDMLGMCASCGGQFASWQLHGQPLRGCVYRLPTCVFVPVSASFVPPRCRPFFSLSCTTPLPAAPCFTQQAPSPRGTQGGKVGIYIWICTPSLYSDVHND